ncbi:MAG TPA: DUF2512 family protein [Bacillota bacterium]|nr:DUF2512 family protein [Bacillota bacterium]HOB87730.1 DUF2512 family protein [Bacillota bacterium]HPU01420.1 DUF2512 family protein [Bacillota bacterium]
MEHIRPLIIKFIYIAAITMIFLGYLLVPAVPMGSTLLIALVVTLVLYFAGDRYLLPRFGALPAAIANFIIAAVILVLAEPFVRQDIGAGGILATAAVIGVAEWVFFRYLRSQMGMVTEEENMASAPEFFGSVEEPRESGGSGEERREEHEEKPEQ